MPTIKKVYTKKEYYHLMKKIEKEHPEIMWADGQKPTRWEPNGFPRYIKLDTTFGGNKILHCYS